MSRPSWVEVDLGAVARNVQAFSAYASGPDLCAVVKADAYGHGAVEVAATALEAGATTLAAATVEEAVQLREAGIETPVLLLSEPPLDDLETVVALRLTPTLYRERTVHALARVARDRGIERFEVHLKVDTGMHRVGAAPESVDGLLHRLETSSPLWLSGVWTHFAVADSDPEFTRRQMDRYREALVPHEERLARGRVPPLRHAANTPGVLFHPESHLDMVRVGLGMYGLHPHPSSRSLIELRPAMRIVSHVTHVRRHPAGTRPSYGRMRALPRDSTVATLPVGYADGVPRLLSDRGEVLMGGRRFSLAGRVTMDQILVDVGDYPVKVGDQAVLVGVQGREEIGFDDWAEWSDTINYEVVSRIGPRLPRRYVP